MQTEKSRTRAWWLILALAATAIGLTLIGLALIGWNQIRQLQTSGPTESMLAIGEAAKVESMDVALQPPVELDFKSKAEVLQLRQEAVERHPELLAREYVPSRAVFGFVEDGVPWWGIEGHFYYDSGERSIEGASEESRFIVNPFLLAAAEFNVLFAGRMTKEELSTFPLYCVPRNLHWRPREAYAEVSYDASCVAMRSDYPFTLIAYNARDLGLNYIFVSYPDSVNITKQDQPQEPYANPQFIHKGGSCGYPGGCNNMSPSTPEISQLRVTALPAIVTIWFWNQKPASTEQDPDMTFVIRFQ
jgi:hypothetical protein